MLHGRQKTPPMQHQGLSVCECCKGARPAPATRQQGNSALTRKGWVQRCLGSLRFASVSQRNDTPADTQAEIPAVVARG